MLERTRSAQERWDERVNACPVALTRSLFPDDAVAAIYKPVSLPYDLRESTETDMGAAF
jgi:hypothetical protein